MDSIVSILSQQVSKARRVPQPRSSMKITKGGEAYGNQYESEGAKQFFNTNYRKKSHSTINKVPDQPSFLDYQKVIIENEGLKSEVKRLYEILEIKIDGMPKSCERVKTEIKKDKNIPQDERNHYKKVIQKSYFSIREMQKQIQMLNKNLEQNKQKIQTLQHKSRILELENHSLKKNLSDLGQIHHQQISFCSDRIRKLEFRIEQLVNLMQEDQYQWRKHQQQLHKLKKFYFIRTSH